MTIESVDEKRGFDCQIVSSGFCVNWKQHPGTGHKEATHGPALGPETSSFLTIKQNKNINTRTTRDESKNQRK